MGTGFDVSLGQHEQGIIPRAVHQLFQGIQSRRARAQEAGIQPPEFKVSAQFLEVGASGSVCVGVMGRMLVHINSHQMGQNKKTGGSARCRTNRKRQCDDRWPGMCALNNVNHYLWHYCPSLQWRRWIRARDEGRERCLCSNNEIIWQVITSCGGFWQGNV